MSGNGTSVWEEHRQLKKDIMKVESSATGTIHKIDRYQAMADLEAHSIAMTKNMQRMGADRLRLFQMDGMSADLSKVEQEQAQLSQSVVKMNEKAKKQSAMEKDAATRLGEQPAYFERSADSLKAARNTVLAEVQEDRLTTKVKDITGDEFALEPDGTMQGSIEDLLRHRMTLAKVVQRNKKEQLTGDNALGARYNTELLKRMDEAIKLFYEANGVDFANGKNVGNIWKKRARKKFALAMESYRDFKKNMNDYLYHEKIKEIKESPQYKERMREMEKSDLAQGETLAESRENHLEAVRNRGENLKIFANQLTLNPTLQQTVIEMRDMMRTHEDKYRENKETVDRLYGELLNYMQKLDRTQNKRKALTDGLITQGSTSLSGISRIVSDRIDDVFSKETGRLSGWIENLSSALSYLLEGKQPENFSIHVFLADHCGIMTDVFRQANQDLEAMEQLQELGKTDEWISERLDRISTLRQKGKTYEQIADVFTSMEQMQELGKTDAWLSERLDRISALKEEGKNYKQIADVLAYEDFERREAHREVALQAQYAVLKTSAESAPASAEGTEETEEQRSYRECESVNRALDRMSQRGSRNPGDPMAILRRNMLLNVRDAQDYNRSRDMGLALVNGSVVDEKFRYTNASGKRENIYKNDVLHRDAISNVSPLNHPGECDIDEAAHYLDNIDIMTMGRTSYIGKQMPNEQAYQVRFQLAIMEELKLQKDAMKEMTDYMKENGLWELDPSQISMEELIQKAQEVRGVYEKGQGLTARAEAVLKTNFFLELPESIQRECVETASFQSAVLEYSGYISRYYLARARGGDYGKKEPLEEIIESKRQRYMPYMTPKEEQQQRPVEQNKADLSIIREMVAQGKTQEEIRDRLKSDNER